MLRPKILCVAATVSLLLVTGCGSKNSATSKDFDDLQSHTDDTIGVTVDYPKAWGETQEVRGGFVVFMDKEGTTSFRRNVNVIKQVDGSSLDDVVKTSDESLRKHGGEVLETKSITLSGIPAIAETVQMKAGNGTVKSYTIFAQKDGFRYNVTYTGGSNNYQDKLDDAQRIIESVKIV